MRTKAYVTLTKDQNNPYWLCTACPWKLIEIGFIPHIGALVYGKDMDEDKCYYGIVDICSQGHLEFPLPLKFEEKPRKNYEQIFHLATYTPYNDLSCTFILSCDIIHSYNEYRKFKSRKIVDFKEYRIDIQRWFKMECARLISRWERKMGIAVEEYYKITNLEVTITEEEIRKKTKELKDFYE